MKIGFKCSLFLEEKENPKDEKGKGERINRG
jgi:hypothetical protein